MVRKGGVWEAGFRVRSTGEIGIAVAYWSVYTQRFAVTG